jgi:hypothetical protein
MDLAGWEQVDGANPTSWESVTADKMNLTCRVREKEFPDLDDIAAVRRVFRTKFLDQHAGLVSCDQQDIQGRRAVRVIAKRFSGQGQALRFMGILVIPISDWIVELMIEGSEIFPSGVRDAIILSELASSAPAELVASMKPGAIPLEWKFERYDPSKTHGLSYTVMDDEKYDLRFPDHPLSRVRRWLRRAENTLRLTLRADSSYTFNWSFLQLPPQTMTLEELKRQLGEPVAMDIIMMLAVSRVQSADKSPINLDFRVRQQVCHQTMTTRLNEIINTHQQNTEIAKRTADKTKEILDSLRPEDIHVFFLWDRGVCRWFTRIGSQGREVLPVFVNLVYAEDYLDAKQLNCEVRKLGGSEATAALREEASRGVEDLEQNPCPRCETHASVPLEALFVESRMHLLFAATVASKRVCADMNFESALKEADPGKRLNLLRYIIDHFDPGEVRVHREIIHTAKQLGDLESEAKSFAALLKYQPT